VISTLAILHVVLARGTYAEQYILSGIFFWLMAWRVLTQYGLGANAKAPAELASASCLCAAFLKAGFLWSRRGFDVLATLGYNLSLDILDSVSLGVSAGDRVRHSREIYRRTDASLSGRLMELRRPGSSAFSAAWSLRRCCHVAASASPQSSYTLGQAFSRTASVAYRRRRIRPWRLRSRENETNCSGH
jgi:hypothetical protein